MAPISVTVFTGFLGIIQVKLVGNAMLICLHRRCGKNEPDPQVSPPIASRLQGRFAKERIRGCPR